MEIGHTSHNCLYALRRLVCMALLLLSGWAHGQKKQHYYIRDGRMVIEIPFNISKGALDSFVSKFELQSLFLEQMVMKNISDSLRKEGWKLERASRESFIISRALEPMGKPNQLADRILFAEDMDFASRFPITDVRIPFGYNRFRNKHSFALGEDSMVVFFLRQQKEAGRVMLAGSFNNWNPDALPMKKVDSGWIASVRLVPGKYWYKFIIDGNWVIDGDNQLRENDGEGNTNSVYYRPNAVFSLPGHSGAKKVFLAGSFNGWDPNALPMLRTAQGWTLPVYLAQGTHTYKFVVDGAWLHDDANAAKVPDGEGGFNSVIALGKPHRFRLNGFENAKEVRLAGSFNNWRSFELYLQQTAGGWELPYVLGPGNWEYKFIVDGKWIADPANAPAGPEGASTLVIDPNHTFRLTGFADARKVYLAGSFNNWSPEAFPMKREGDAWVLPVHLGLGKHLYKFVVDGKWILDPGNKLWEQNEHGTGNSIYWRKQKSE